MCACTCERACVRACVHMYMRACMRASVRACVRVSVEIVPRLMCYKRASLRVVNAAWLMSCPCWNGRFDHGKQTELWAIYGWIGLCHSLYFFFCRLFPHEFCLLLYLRSPRDHNITIALYRIIKDPQICQRLCLTQYNELAEHAQCRTKY